MKDVTEFEAKLLRILRCVMHRAPVEHTLPLLVKSTKRPRCLSRNCVELVQDGLSKGVTEWLARSGWAHNRFLHNDRITEGRLWTRHPTDRLQLTFSPHSMELLIWLATQNFVEPKTNLKLDSLALTTGDRLLMLMTFSAIRSTLGGATFLKQCCSADDGLISLMFPADVAVMTDNAAGELNSWCQPNGSWVLESLQSNLAIQWFRIERHKRRSANDADLVRIGEFQTTVLRNLFDAVDRNDRRDLCVFLLKTGQLLLQTSPSDQWFDRLDVSHLRMADRSGVYKSALAFFHATEKLWEWNRESLSVGFYDENYQASQLWKLEWERLRGDDLCRRAREIINRVDPVRAIVAAE